MLQIWLSALHGHAKLVAIDEQPDDDIVYHDRFGKTDRFAGQPLNAGSQRQMLPFNLLRIAFARNMSFSSQMSAIRPPMIGKEPRDAKGLQQGFEPPEHLVLATTEDIR